MFFFTCVVLFPDRIDDYAGYADYLQSRRRWFYGLLAALFMVDLVDRAVKGANHFRALGLAYPIRQALLCALALAAMCVADRRYHLAFVCLALVAEVW